MIYISWLPFWDNPIKDFASSRLRCFFHHENLNNHFNFKFFSTIGISPSISDTNILIVTQKIKNENIDKVKEFKNSNKKNIIIYDIVDNYYTDSNVKILFDLCDFIIVANDIQQNLISKHVNKKIFVLHDCIDYPEQMNTSITEINNNIVWFGNNSGLGNIRSFLLNLIANKYNINIIGKCGYYKRHVPGSKCIEWNYDNFIKNLKKNSIAFLSHDLNQQQKSNNKLLVCIANGVPVLSFQSTSYEKILRRFNLEYAIINNRQDLMRAVNILSQSEKREEYFENIQPYVLEKYNSFKTTEKLVDIIDLIIGQKEMEFDLNRNCLEINNDIKKISILKPNKSIQRFNKIPEKLKDISENIHNNKKILLYTANFGNYDSFCDIETPFYNHIDYLYITDKPIDSKTWKIKVYNNVENPFMTSKMFKILPHRFFPEYDISIWIDASAKNIRTNFSNLLKYLDQYNFIITRHPSRKCVYDEATVCIKNKRDDPEKILKQINRYSNDKYPHKNGLFSCGFLIRKHNEISKFSDCWWTEIINNCCRDQISFPYIYNKFSDIVKLKIFDNDEHKNHFDWKRHSKTKLIISDKNLKKTILRKKNW